MPDPRTDPDGHEEWVAERALRRLAEQMRAEQQA